MWDLEHKLFVARVVSHEIKDSKIKKNVFLAQNIHSLG